MHCGGFPCNGHSLLIGYLNDYSYLGWMVGCVYILSFDRGWFLRTLRTDITTLRSSYSNLRVFSIPRLDR
jgi:hypothetical protein